MNIQQNNVEPPGQLVPLFFLYSPAGRLIEVTLKFIQFHRFINRGFLTGPIFPIYGSGALLITLAGRVFPGQPAPTEPAFCCLSCSVGRWNT